MGRNAEGFGAGIGSLAGMKLEEIKMDLCDILAVAILAIAGIIILSIINAGAPSTYLGCECEDADHGLQCPKKRVLKFLERE